MTINIPTFVKQIFTQSNGHLMPEMHLFFDQLIDQLRNNFSEDGLVVPSASNDDINTISNPNNPNGRPNGTIWYDTDNNVLKAKINGTVKIIQTL